MQVISDYILINITLICQYFILKFYFSKYTLAHRRILLFTVSDNPHGGNMQLEIQAKTKAKDLRDSNIEIDLFPIKKAGTEFDFSLFYKVNFSLNLMKTYL